MRGGRRLIGAVGAFVIVVAAVALIQMARVHLESWEWRLAPSAAPPKVHFADRDYTRGSPKPSVPPGYVKRGETRGGGLIYTWSTGGEPQVILYVRAGRGVWPYALMGGP